MSITKVQFNGVSCTFRKLPDSQMVEVKTRLTTAIFEIRENDVKLISRKLDQSVILSCEEHIHRYQAYKKQQRDDR